jgi:hypothetical protein
MLWWLRLTFLVHGSARWLRPAVLIWINASGAVLIAVALYAPAQVPERSAGRPPASRLNFNRMPQHRGRLGSPVRTGLTVSR